MLKTAVVGLGKISSRYLSDEKISKNIKYSTHLQVIQQNKNFDLCAAVDTSIEACNYAKNNYFINEVVSDIGELLNKGDIQILVLATPPNFRLDILKEFPSLLGIIVEKPLAENLKDAKYFLKECERRDILVQVNLTRRSDSVMKQLSGKGLSNKVGKIQCVFGTYGRGICNYGIHLIDLIQMLFGDFLSVMALSDNKKHKDNGPINSDYNLSFLLNMVNGLQIMIQPLDYANYREGSLDIWGEKGRIEIVHEGLNYIQTEVGDCRTLSGAKELSFDKNNMYSTGYGESLFNLYENLANAINYGEDLDSPGKTALVSQSIVDSIIRSYKMGGKRIIC